MRTVNKTLKILLVEDNLADAKWIKNMLARYSKYFIQHIKNLETAICTLKQDFDVVLLDSLPDSQGIASVAAIKQQAPQIPIVILTATDNFELATQAIREGAQDYLVKGEFTARSLTRAIQYGIERQRIEFSNRQQALMKQMLDIYCPENFATTGRATNTPSEFANE